MNKVRVTTRKVSFSKKYFRECVLDAHIQYNGAAEEYEDIADYFAQSITLKGVRIA